ncbi:Uncharacterized protein QTN25_010092 [Entamoeba marina]
MSDNNDLFIERQSSIMTEMIRGEEILVVVKQCNFVLTISSKNHVLDGAEVTCELLYDSKDMQPVSYINQPPIKYKALQANEHSINIECKLNVLSSQHEDHFFRVKVVVIINGETIGNVFSSPIRAISKLDPQKKEMIRKKKSELACNHHSSDKKPKHSVKGDDLLNKTNSSVGLLALLSSNTLLLEELKNKECGTAVSLEDGFLSLIQKYLQGSRKKSNLYDAIASLGSHELSGLEEISSVVEVTARNENIQRTTDFNNRYPYSEPIRSQQSQQPFDSKNYIGYVNPFLC